MTIACSPTPADATLVATGGTDHKVFCGAWVLQIGVRSSLVCATVSSLAFSADGKLLTSGSFDKLIKVWDAYSGALSAHLKVLEIILRWHPSERILLAGSEDGIAWMWDADNNAYLNTFLGHEESVTCGDFTPDGKTVCTGSEDGSLRIWKWNSESIHVKGMNFGSS
ncbi:hypothetical protein GIB67_033636 [Kingdonia uniflora]|uniref:Uncharacterized protein n=1 Tax=Kingdonia uniflora TaxID=39325 RepID=A0A7J7LAN9_9MAGN|nr:hypothetical protein GIB67_033636 [Kingdonia uniflora]